MITTTHTRTYSPTGNYVPQPLSVATLRRIEEKRNQPRPAGHAIVNKTTIWVTTWHARKEVDPFYGKWWSRTTKYKSNAKRRATIAAWKAMQANVLDLRVQREVAHG